MEHSSTDRSTVSEPVSELVCRGDGSVGEEERAEGDDPVLGENDDAAMELVGGKSDDAASELVVEEVDDERDEARGAGV